MKIPEKPITPGGVAPGTVSGSSFVQDSGPTGHKDPVGRAAPPVSEGSRELAALVDGGQLTPVQAMEQVIDAIVRQSPGPDPEGLRHFLISQVATDPQLRQLAASLGLDAQSLEGMVASSEQVKS